MALQNGHAEHRRRGASGPARPIRRFWDGWPSTPAESGAPIKLQTAPSVRHSALVPTRGSVIGRRDYGQPARPDESRPESAEPSTCLPVPRTRSGIETILGAWATVIFAGTLSECSKAGTALRVRPVLTDLEVSWKKMPSLRRRIGERLRRVRRLGRWRSAAPGAGAGARPRKSRRRSPRTHGAFPPCGTGPTVWRPCASADRRT